MTYEEAINLLKQGNESGFQYLYNTTYETCLYVIGEIIKDYSEAENILQDAYINAIQKIDTLDEPEKFPAWFRTIASHLAIKQAKKNKKSKPANPNEDESPASVMDRIINENSINNQITPEEAYGCREASRLLRELIDDLPEVQRQCTILFYMEEYSIEDIAEICDCSENTVNSKLYYGKNKLEEKTIEMQNKGCVLGGVTPDYLITWLLKTDMTNKMKFVYSNAGTNEFIHILFSKVMAAKNVESTAKKSGIHSLAGKLIIGIVAAVVSVVAVAVITNKNVLSKSSGNVLMSDVFIIDYYNYSPDTEIATVLGSEYERSEILTITFLNSLDNMPSDSWDVSEKGNGSVMACVTDSGNADVPYNLYIAGNGGVDANENCSGFFRNYENVTNINFNNCFYTGNTTDMSYIFYGCISLTSLDLSGFDTSGVTDMSWMFAGCNLLTSLDLSGFDTSNVTNMNHMFIGCSSITSLDLSNFDTSNVTDMSTMFLSCSSLTILDLSSFDTSNVTDMCYMFSRCSSLTTLDLSSFDTSNVTNMYGMFLFSNSLTTLDLSSFDTMNVTDMNSMFEGCNSLTTLNLSSFDTSNVTDMTSMFSRCSSLTTLNLSSFDTSNVTDMTSMFSRCSSLTTLNLNSFDTTNVTDMSSMFEGCSSLTTLNLSSFGTSNITDMRCMFYGCSSLTTLDLSSFDTSNVAYMDSMFENCSSLTNIITSPTFTTANADTTDMYAGTIWR